jgi:hypothetical protein
MRARKWPGMGWQAYAASALLEWRHEAKDAIPRNIFELGLKSHLGQPGLVLAYAQFLLGGCTPGGGGGKCLSVGNREGWGPASPAWLRLPLPSICCPCPKPLPLLTHTHTHPAGLGDIPNTRALFERAVAAAAPADAAPLWDAYLAFEYDVGSLAAAAAVEQRRAEAAAAAREAAAAAAAGAALDGKTAAAAGEEAGHEALRLALLKYRVQGLFPGSGAQRAYMERLLGEAPGEAEVCRCCCGCCHRLPNPPASEAHAGAVQLLRMPASQLVRAEPAWCCSDWQETRERDGGSKRERERERKHRDRSPTPPRHGHAPRSPQPRAAEPLRLSRELAQLLNQLPPKHACEEGRGGRARALPSALQHLSAFRGGCCLGSQRAGPALQPTPRWSLNPVLPPPPPCSQWRALCRMWSVWCR